eukprot:m51a1_g4767 hypothetical protein (343) ;mRNA; r:13512-14921
MDLLRFELGGRTTVRQRMRSWPRLVALAVGIYASFIVVGICQETLFTTNFGTAENPEHFRYPATLVMSAFVVSAAISMSVMTMAGMDVRPQAPVRSFALLAASHSLSMVLANAALLHLDFPTQTLLKSCKPFPVLISGLLFLKSMYRPRRGISVLLICTGLVTFMYFKKESERQDGRSWLGVALAVCSLALDGVSAFLQDLICQGYYADERRGLLAPWHLMYYVNLFAACYVFVWISITGELGDSFSFVAGHWGAVLILLAFACASALGVSLVYQIVARYDSLTCSVTTTLRKFLAIMASVVWFGHAVLPVQWVAVVAVFLGIAFEARESHKEAEKKVISIL